MVHSVDILFQGFTGVCDTGALGWSTIALLRADEGYALIDTGTARNRRRLLTRLRELQIDPAAVSHVLLTHLHWDHIGNVDLFPNAEICVSEAEWKTADPDDPAYYPIVLDYLKRRGVRLLAGVGEEVLRGVSAHLTPGHTWGSVSFVAEWNAAQVVFAGDAAKTRHELRSGAVIMSKNMELSRSSIRKLLTLGDNFVPGHDVWCRREGRQIVPIHENSAVISFPAGITMNGASQVKLFID